MTRRPWRTERLDPYKQTAPAKWFRKVASTVSKLTSSTGLGSANGSRDDQREDSRSVSFNFGFRFGANSHRRHAQMRVGPLLFTKKARGLSDQCARCRHATLACFKSLQKANPNVRRSPVSVRATMNCALTPFELLRHWEWTGQAKIALQVKSEDELLLLQASAQSLNLVARVIHDA